MKELCYLTLYTLIYHLLSLQPLWFMIFLTDNLFLAYNTIVGIYYPSYQNQFYIKMSYYQRVVYYVMIITLLPFVKMLFFTTHPVIKWLLFITTMPPVLWHIHHTNFWIIYLIKRQMNKIYKFILFNVLSYLLNTICYQILRYNPCFNNKEISYIYKKNHKNTINVIIKNFIIVTLMKNFNDQSVSGRLVKMFYNQNADIPYKDPLPFIDNHVEKLKTLLFKRKWKELSNPYMMAIFFEVYEKQSLGTNQLLDYMNECFMNMDMIVAKIFTMTTFLSVQYLFFTHDYAQVVIITLLTFLLSSHLTPISTIIRIVGLIGVYMNYTITGIVVCECSDYLVNSFTIWLWRHFKQWCYDRTHLLTHYTEQNTDIFLHLCYFSFHYMIINNVPLWGLSGSFMIMIGKYPSLTMWFICFGLFSNYDPIHVVILTLFYYLMINLYHVRGAPKPKISILMIGDYDRTVLSSKPLMKVNINMDYKSKINIVPTDTMAIHLPILNLMQNPKWMIEPT